MRNTARSITIAFTIVLAVISCCLRFYQLLCCTDSTTGLVTRNEALSFIIYGMFFIELLVAVIYSRSTERTEHRLMFLGNRSIYASLLILMLSFFFDFLHQGYSIYKYLANTEYVRLNFIIPLAVTCAGALLSVFYIYIVSLTVSGGNYDFRSFRVLHFSPFIWGFSRLLLVFLDMSYAGKGAESFCEFVFLSAFLMLCLCVIMAIDRNDGRITSYLSLCNVLTIYAGIVIAIPRTLMMLTLHTELLSASSFSCITYLAITAFSYELLMSYNNKPNGD